MKKTVKIGKTTRKTSKRRRSPNSSRRGKIKYSDAIRAFLLVGLIVALSALISCAVIMVHSNVNKEEETQIESKPPTEQVSPIVVTVAPQPVSEKIQPQPNAKPEPKIEAKIEPKPESKPATPVATTVAAAITPKPTVGTLVFVIDDAGNSLKDLDAFLKVPFPLTIAVLPGLANSAESAKRIRDAGKEVILHQPMEAIGAQDPGPGAIYTGMSASEIRTILARNIAEIGPVAGINNHQGSKVTMDIEAMQTILAFCRENGLYFLDSRTTADTVAPSVAKRMGIKIAERNIFIDNEQNKDTMLRYIKGGLARARTNGSAVLIGHTWSPDLAPLLSEQSPVFMEQGYAVKTVSELIK